VVESLQHECGIALVRLLRPLAHYADRYGTPLWGLRLLYALLEKQRNRGQDGAGLACLRLDQPPGRPYIALERSADPAAWQTLVHRLEGRVDALLHQQPDLLEHPDLLHDRFDFAGHILLGHLRYGTFGFNSIDYCHPFLRTNNWRSRNLVLAGNFNLTNVEEQFQHLVELGQHPPFRSDTITVLERIGHFLDEAVESLFQQHKAAGHSNVDITARIARELDIAAVLRRAARPWDGGFVMTGFTGSGSAFAVRDPWGIRPAWFFADDEVVAVASERVALAAALAQPAERVQELPPAHALCIDAAGGWTVEAVREAQPRRSCSFERIYFARGTDPEIYAERRALGAHLAPRVVQQLSRPPAETVLTWVPNTAFTAFLGLVERLRTDWPSFRAEQVIVKDTQLRTFITQRSERNRMVSSVYDLTLGLVRPGRDALVCLDDSIVRGTTLRESLLRLLARLEPAELVIASSAPQIRYPDCYGIDMSQLEQFVAFQAAISLLRERGEGGLIDAVYQEIKALEAQGQLTERNCVQQIYAPFTEEEISQRIAQLLTPPELRCPLRVVFQTVDDLQAALSPDHHGCWYFTGDYPTPGGNRVANRAFLNFYERRDERAYA
jgi:amidophosphoribosyltransferase